MAAVVWKTVIAFLLSESDGKAELYCVNNVRAAEAYCW